MARMYLSGMAAMEAGGIVWGVTDMRVALVTNGYTFDETDDYLSEITNEITNANYARKALTCSIVADEGNHRNLLDANNVAWTSLGAGDQPYAAVIYKYNIADGAAQLFAYVLLTAPPAPNGGDYTVVWNTLGIVTDTSS